MVAHLISGGIVWSSGAGSGVYTSTCMVALVIWVALVA